MSQKQVGGIPVIEASPMRSGRRKVLGELTAAELVGRAVVPRRDHSDQTGYQRPVSKTRVNRLAGELTAEHVDLPTAVLLNLRDFDEETHLSRREGVTYLSLDGESLYVVDGQHRIASLEHVLEDDPEKWRDFGIPFVCLLGANEGEEIEQFHVVNSTAKSVRTDLALELLKQRAELDPNLRTTLVEHGEVWKIQAQTLVEHLSETELWRPRIRFSGDPVASTTIGSSGMANSLRALLGTPYFGAITRENQLKVLQAYWRGIREVIPEAFEDPKNMTLQKATGVTCMHQLLISVLEYVRSRGRSVVEPESYTDAMREALLDLQGDTAEGGVVSGAAFWVAGAEGAAGSFSSNAGRRVLVARLRSMLPEVMVT